jgi:hypothetical protein
MMLEDPAAHKKQQKYTYYTRFLFLTVYLQVTMTPMHIQCHLSTTHYHGNPFQFQNRNRREKLEQRQSQEDMFGIQTRFLKR